MDQVIDALRPQLSRITQAETFIRAAGGLGLGSGQGNIRWMLGGPDLARTAEWSNDLAARLEDDPRLASVEVGYSANQPGASLSIDRTRAQVSHGRGALRTGRGLPHHPLPLRRLPNETSRAVQRAAGSRTTRGGPSAYGNGHRRRADSTG